MGNRKGNAGRDGRLVEFSSPSKAAANDALRKLIERDYPGLIAQEGC